MIGRSFATEDAHDQIRAAVVDLFEVLELEMEANTEEVRSIRVYILHPVNIVERYSSTGPPDKKQESRPRLD